MTSMVVSNACLLVGVGCEWWRGCITSTLFLYPARDIRAMIDQPASPARHVLSLSLELLVVGISMQSFVLPIG
jgi:hypothetical protein